MNTTTFVTANQKAHLQAALALTGSDGFMEDARAVAAYRPGHDGEADQIRAAFVFECFRGGRAELHFGMADGAPLTQDLVQAVIMIAFTPKFFNLDRLMCRVPAYNARALIALIKIGFQMEYRDRASVTGGADAIMLSLDRTTILEAPAEPSDDDYLPDPSGDHAQE